MTATATRAGTGAVVATWALLALLAAGCSGNDPGTEPDPGDGGADVPTDQRAPDGEPDPGGDGAGPDAVSDAPGGDGDSPDGDGERPPDADDATGNEPAPLSFLALPPEHAIAGGTWRHRLRVTTAGAPSFTVMAGPDGKSISEAGVVTWSPTPDDAGVHEVALRAMVGERKATQSFELEGVRVEELATSSTGAAGGTVTADTDQDGVEDLGVEVPEGTLDEERTIRIGRPDSIPSAPPVEAPEQLGALNADAGGASFRRPVRVRVP